VSAVKSWSGAGIFNSDTGALVCIHSDGKANDSDNKCEMLP
jgi:hypothetical protein